MAIAIWIAFFATKSSAGRTAFDKHTERVFSDAGVQMKIPVETPFQSSRTNDVLVMLHPVEHGASVEIGYLIEIHIRRLSPQEVESNMRMTSHPLTDDFNKWLTAKHPNLDVRKQANVWRIRKDIETPDGKVLFVDCKLVVTKSIDKDFLEIVRIIDSVRGLL